jgi:5-(carboxyamino)imidazole ribonucleotide mutase
LAHKVAILMGSKSDMGVMQASADVLAEFGIEADVKVMSAHRTPKAVAAFAEGAVDAGYDVIIAGAGVPVKSAALNGLDSLLSMVQMPSGVPVATVAIDGAKNAGILAAQIIGVGDRDVQNRIVEFKEKMAGGV